ncbi:MAG: UPF0280 family protein [Thermoleophilia bacterium]|nr:UPF0280 family protein [Thermoleophilia bacterium]
MVTPRGPGRIDLDHGPVSLRVLARRTGIPHTAAARKAAEAAEQALAQLAPLLTTASVPATELKFDERWPRVLQLMVEAAKRTGDPTATPMIAVAGSIAEVSLREALAAGAGTVIVENGGDIALAVERGDSVRVGIARSLVDRTIGHTLTITGPSQIGGICTSGLGGRSFTRGIAEAAVALSASASQADACATLLGNATFMEDPAITQVPAGCLDPNSDIPHFLVTVSVGRLAEAMIHSALSLARKKAQELIARGLLQGALVTVQGTSTIVLPESTANLEVTQPGTFKQQRLP